MSITKPHERHSGSSLRSGWFFNISTPNGVMISIIFMPKDCSPGTAFMVISSLASLFIVLRNVEPHKLSFSLLP